MLAVDLSGFTLATIMLIVIVLVLGWVEGVITGRRVRRAPSPAAPIALPFVVSTEIPDLAA